HGLRVTYPEIHLAVQGNGFFVLKKDDDFIYSRYGRFFIDENGSVRQVETNLALMYFNEGKLIPARIYTSKPFKRLNKDEPYVVSASLENVGTELDGKMWLKYSDGTKYMTGRIALAVFDNPRDLLRIRKHSLT